MERNQFTSNYQDKVGHLSQIGIDAALKCDMGRIIFHCACFMIRTIRIESACNLIMNLRILVIWVSVYESELD